MCVAIVPSSFGPTNHSGNQSGAGANAMKVIRAGSTFLSDDMGLVTTEWVAIAAAVVVMSIGVASIIEPSVNAAAFTAGANLLAAVNSNS